MNAHRIPVMLLDDEAMIHDGVEANVTPTYDFRGFTEPDHFVDAVLADPRPLILLVDHDLNKGASLTGYEVVHRIREQHPYGLILPIIYYSARENPSGYATRTARELMFSPTALVPKAGDEDALFDAIDRAADLVDQIVSLASEQVLQQALHSEGLGEDADILDERIRQTGEAE